MTSSSNLDLGSSNLDLGSSNLDLGSVEFGKGFSSNSKKLTRDIYVDSSRRTEPYGNTYTMYIPDPIKNITQVDLVAAVVPNTMYNITNSNVFSITYGLENTVYYFTYPYHTYDSNHINTSNLPGYASYAGGRYQVTFDGTQYLQYSDSVLKTENLGNFRVEITFAISSSAPNSGYMAIAGQNVNGSSNWTFAFDLATNCVVFMNGHSGIWYSRVSLDRDMTYEYYISFNNYYISLIYNYEKDTLYTDGTSTQNLGPFTPEGYGPINDGSDLFFGWDGGGDYNFGFGSCLQLIGSLRYFIITNLSYSDRVFIDPGFYSLCSLNNILNNNQSIVTFSSLDGQGKIIASSSSSFSFTNVSSEFTNITKITNGDSYLAGSTLGQYSGQQIITSNSVVDFHTAGNFVFLEIDELRPPYPIDAVSYSKDPSGYSNNFVFSESFRKFATIPMDNLSGTLKTFKEMGDYKISVNYQIPIDRVDRLSIKWLDTNGNVLNFNGVEQNSFILRFHYLEPEIKEESKFDIVKKTIKSKSIIFYFILTFVIIIIILFI